MKKRYGAEGQIEGGLVRPRKKGPSDDLKYIRRDPPHFPIFKDDLRPQIGPLIQAYLGPFMHPE